MVTKPGHAAFSQMRSRGANVADIAILVVSAEDGVKQQTKEAFASIKEAGTPYIVAINKIDLPGANVEMTKQNLAENNIFVEGYGGDVPFVPISAKTGDGVDELLDMMLLVSEMEGLVGDEGINAEGVIIESHLDPKKGVSATVVIKNGVLKGGMYIVAEDSVSPVRIFENFLGKPIKEARFSSPVHVTGCACCWISIYFLFFQKRS
jgi:translation initiation factor IF-2